ncbi:MAG: hypothetical protein ACI81S_001502 [Sphingobacteriales bacterium]
MALSANKKLGFIIASVIIPFIVYTFVYYKKEIAVYFPKDKWVSMNFQYGEGEYSSEWDTERGEFVTSLFGDSITKIKMPLLPAEADTIWRMMEEVEFFKYPSNLEFPVGTKSDTVELIQYKYEMRFIHRTKFLTWEKHLFTENQKATDLRKLSRLVRRIISDKPEFREIAGE